MAKGALQLFLPAYEFLCLKACIVPCDCGLLSGRWCLCPHCLPASSTWHDNSSVECASGWLPCSSA